jgi:hypothetical protein
MWCASILGFYSVVRDREKRGRVLVRARAKADIDNLYRRFSKKFRMSRPKADEHRDYRWRVSMKKRDWTKIVAQLASEIDYCNFKSAVHERPDQENKHSAYLSVWSAMLRVQQSEDHEHRPNNAQRYFNWPDAWQRELDYASGRFDDPAPMPVKTIRSVTTDNHDSHASS